MNDRDLPQSFRSGCACGIQRLIDKNPRRLLGEQRLVLELFTPQECANYIRHCGYRIPVLM